MRGKGSLISRNLCYLLKRFNLPSKTKPPLAFEAALPDEEKIHIDTMCCYVVRIWQRYCLMSEFTAFPLIFGVAVLLVVVFVLTDPRFWGMCRHHWQKKPKSVSYEFTVNGKVHHRGTCKPMEAEPIGIYSLYPEKQLGEYVIIPARYVKKNSTFFVPPIRVDRNDVCMLRIKGIYADK
jgi:hypothetical protein